MSEEKCDAWCLKGGRVAIVSPYIMGHHNSIRSLMEAMVVVEISSPRSHSDMLVCTLGRGMWITHSLVDYLCTQLSLPKADQRFDGRQSYAQLVNVNAICAPFSRIYQSDDDPLRQR